MFDKIIEFVLGKFGIKKDSRLWESIYEFIKFGMVGVSNVIISYLLNIFTLLLLQRWELTIDYVIANLIAFSLSVLWSFYWNNKYVFKLKEGEKRNLYRTLLKTYLAYSFSGIILNNFLSFVWIDLLGLDKFIAPIINLIFTIPINFLLNRLWAFRKEKYER